MQSTVRSPLAEPVGGRRVGDEQPAVRGERVLHVTEALAAGVGLSLARLAALQAESGITPTVIGLRRYDTPDHAELRRWFGPDVELIVYPRAEAGRAVQIVWLSRVLLRMLRSGRFEVLHLHSSFAGAVGRVIAAPFHARVRTFYSPHGFAFLRQDVSAARRACILLAERILARLPAKLVLVSGSEFGVARRVSSKLELLENGVDLGRIGVPGPRSSRRPVVIMIGRITEQKAPWRFAAAATRFAELADFRWLGYGPSEDVERWLGAAPVQVSGRLDHADLIAALRDADIVFFPTLWEGMPLSLIEAQASGLPVVASDIEGNCDVVVDGVTGRLCASDEALQDALRRLIEEPSERSRMSASAIEHAKRFSDAQRGSRSLAMYGIVV